MSPSPPPLYNFEEPPEVPPLYEYDDLIYDDNEGGYVRRVPDHEPAEKAS
jgi:hypothetical protein